MNNTPTKKTLYALQTAWNAIKKFFKTKYTNFKAAPWHGKLWRTILYLFILFLLYLFLVDINFLFLFGKSPGISSIRNPEPNVASELYSEDGKLIGKYFKENRTPVKYEDINPFLVKTLVSTEDERFYDHHGIDFSGLFSAVKDYVVDGKVRGASTITQQLVKNLFKTRSQYSKGLFGQIPGVNIVIAKTKEWITALKIEAIYDKKEILTMYLNTVDFGSNAFGIKTAAQTYFGTTPKNLTIDQCAVLVGMLKATTTYNPKINPKNSTRRRNVVLENLHNHGIISRNQCDSLKKVKIDMHHYNVEQNYTGSGLYFRQAVAEDLRQWCKDNNYDLYSDGLKIYTTIDSKMQKYAEEAVKEEMKKVQRNFDNHWGTHRGSTWGSQEPWRDERQQVIKNFIEEIAKTTELYKDLRNQGLSSDSALSYMESNKHDIRIFDYDNGTTIKQLSSMDSIRYMEGFMHTGFVAIEPQTHKVKAWVGDIDYRQWKYDKVRAERQPGSTFKLFVYTTAMKQGMSPCDMITDEYITWDYKEKTKNGTIKETHWAPHNSEGFCTGATMTLKCAFARSVNTIAVRVAKELSHNDSITDILQTAYDMGINTPLVNRPSTALGASDVTLEELVNAYSTVINEGKAVEKPILVTRIKDRNGNVVYESKDYITEKPGIDEEDAFLMTQMLRGGLTESEGTSMSLWSYISGTQTDFGGKTGTSSNHSDAWFVGVSPKLVAGAWVGGEHRCVHFRTGRLGSGSRTALPIVGSFFKKVLNDENLKDTYRARFSNKPRHEIERDWNCHTTYIPKSDTTDADSTAYQSDSLNTHGNSNPEAVN